MADLKNGKGKIRTGYKKRKRRNKDTSEEKKGEKGMAKEKGERWEGGK